MVYVATGVSGGGSLAVRFLVRSAALSILALTAACGERTMGALCAPDTAAAALRPAATAHPGPMNVYWDGSESIAGYIDGATQSVRALGDLQPLLAAHAQAERTPVRWFRFGQTVTPVASGQDLASSRLYRCAGQAGCDNLESRIDVVLARMAAREGPGLDVLVSDMWLSNSAFRGSAEIALGQPIRSLLARGKSIGVVGIRAPYSGPVYDVPGVRTHRGARERPLYVILVGSRIEVLGAYRRLSRSGSPALAADRTKFALFTPEPTNVWAGAIPFEASGDVRALRLVDGQHADALPQFRVSLESLRSGRSTLRARIPVGVNAVPGAYWRGSLGGRTRVWRRSGACGDSAWTSEPPLSGSLAMTDDGGATFSLTGDSAANLVPGGDYLIQADLTTRTLAPGGAETRWMRDWSVSPERAAAVSASRPDFFPTLGLAALADQLEAGVRETAPAEGLPLTTVAIVVRVDP